MTDEPITTFQELAMQAQRLYHSNDFTGAIDCLNNINSQLGDKRDIRVNQNLIIAQSAKDGFPNLNDILTSLISTSYKSSDPIKLAEKQDSQNSTVEHLLSIVGPDTSTLLFNAASVYFQKHQYDVCKQILEYLFTHIEPIGEWLSLKICFLLIEVLLRSFQENGSVHIDSYRESFENQSSIILKYMDKYCHITDNNSSNGSGDASSDGQSESTSVTGSSTSTTNGLAKSKHAQLRIQLIIFRVHLYRCRVLVALNHLKVAKKEIKNALEVYQRELRPFAADLSSSDNCSNGIIANGSDSESATQSLPSLLLVSLSSLGFHWHSLEHQNQLALYMKANIEYLKRNFRKALKLLTSCHRKELNGTTAATVLHYPDGPGALYFNNLACLYLRMQRNHAAALYFQKALPFLSRSMQEPSACVSSTGLLTHRYSTDILYNTGLSLLLSGKPLEAFRCFDSTANSFRMRPQLWVRMAECCIQYDLKQKEESCKRHPRLFHRVVSRGRSRRILLRQNSGVCGSADDSPEHTEFMNYSSTNRVGTTDSEADGEVESDPERDISLSEPDPASGPDSENGIGSGQGSGSISLSLEQRCSLRRAVRYLSNALYLVRSLKTRSATKTASTGDMARTRMLVSAGAISSSGDGSTSVIEGIDDGASKPAVTSGSNGSGATSQDVSGESAAVDGGGGDSEGGLGSGSAQMRPQVLEETVLLQLCFVHLSLGDPICALSCAKSVLDGPTPLTDRSRFLAQTYSIEALCKLGRMNEAAELVELQGMAPSEQCLSGCVMPSTWTADGTAHAASTVPIVRAVALVNRGSTYALAGRLDEARTHLESALKLSPGFIPAIQGLLYVYLRKGRSVEALQLLRTFRAC